MKQFIPLLLLTMLLTACSITKQETTTGAPADKTNINFSATGNEPFWSLNIDFNASMHFKTIDGYELIVPTVKGEKAADANVTRYYSVTPEGALTVQIFNQPCVDNMSGKNNDFKVQVNLKKSGDKEEQSFNGCGNYLGTYQLNTIWTLQSIGSKNIDLKKTSNRLPNMELNLNEERVFGYAGCNRYSGSFKLEKDSITFGNLLSTKMACAALDVETEFLAALSAEKKPYKIVEGVLYIGKGAKMLTFKKVNVVK
ncbi:heat shock protein HslJ [Pedobacter sp. CG_S7]|uniref:META domain-containing protein n=1 Tax=Pedobacter sp. CG_S7 TaxID=3143930 RepID=UPI003398D1CE